MEKKVQATIRKYNLIEQGDKIVVGVSGGPDSMCLLNILNKIQKAQRILTESKNTQENQKFLETNVPKETWNQCAQMCPKKPGTSVHKCVQRNLEPVGIVVAHINHMLRKEAEEEEEYVRAYCEKNGIEFFAKRIDVENLAHTSKIGTEEAGRKVRYEFFEEVLQKTKANKIAVAHNKNDKVETIFLHTLRGSGMEGLKGIEPKRGKVIRPLIECERAEIEQYCEEKQLEPKVDQSNFENRYARNKIRNVVIPYVQKEFNPNIINTMERLSTIVEAENEYMEKQTKLAYQQVVIEQGVQEIVIDLKKFNLLENVIKSRLIRYIIKSLFGSTVSIEKVHIDDIMKLCTNNIGNKYITPNKNTKVLVKNHKVYFKKI